MVCKVYRPDDVQRFSGAICATGPPSGFELQADLNGGSIVQFSDIGLR